MSSSNKSRYQRHGDTARARPTGWGDLASRVRRPTIHNGEVDTPVGLGASDRHSFDLIRPLVSPMSEGQHKALQHVLDVALDGSTSQATLLPAKDMVLRYFGSKRFRDHLQRIPLNLADCLGTRAYNAVKNRRSGVVSPATATRPVAILPATNTAPALLAARITDRSIFQEGGVARREVNAVTAEYRSSVGMTPLPSEPPVMVFAQLDSFEQSTPEMLPNREVISRALGAFAFEFGVLELRSEK